MINISQQSFDRSWYSSIILGFGVSLWPGKLKDILNALMNYMLNSLPAGIHSSFHYHLNNKTKESVISNKQ